MDIEYQYEAFNGLPVYYGGDMYDSEDTEGFDPDVPAAMGGMTYAERPPDERGKYGSRGLDCIEGSEV